jgi:hypothetical protein
MHEKAIVGVVVCTVGSDGGGVVRDAECCWREDIVASEQVPQWEGGEDGD